MRPGERVGLYSVNCADWVLTEGALTRAGCVSVPLYDTLGPDAVQFICNHAELVAVACHAAVLSTMLATLPACPSVKLVVVFGMKRGAAAPPPSLVPGVAVRPTTVRPMCTLTVLTQRATVARLLRWTPCAPRGASRPRRRTRRTPTTWPQSATRRVRACAAAHVPHAHRLRRAYVRIIATGTTGNPKGVVLTVRAPRVRVTHAAHS